MCEHSFSLAVVSVANAAQLIRDQTSALLVEFTKQFKCVDNHATADCLADNSHEQLRCICSFVFLPFGGFKRRKNIKCSVFFSFLAALPPPLEKAKRKTKFEEK